MKSAMHRYLSSHFLVVALLFHAGPVSGSVQVDSVQVPMDLALVLLSNPGADTRISVSTVPAEVQESIPFGPVERVVGGLLRESGGTAVVEVRGDAARAIDNYFEHLQGQGWERATMPMDRHGGFQRTSSVTRSTWCGDGYAIWPSSTTVASRTYLRLAYARRDEGRDPCDILEPPNMARRDPFGGLELPVLEAPPETEVQMEDQGRSMNSLHMHASIVSQSGVESIFEHYARQLTAAGWTPEGRANGDGISMGRWRTQDAEGAAVVGTMAIWPLTVADSYRASLRLDRPEPQR